MPSAPIRTVPGLPVLAAALLLFSAAPAFAQSVGIDFGGTAGEDTLLGGGSARSASPAVSGGSDLREPRYAEPRIHARPRSGDAVGGWTHGARPSLSVQYVHAVPRSSYFRGTGVFANAQGRSASVVYYQRPSQERDDARGAGPKMIDVAAQRLDRQPIGPGGISVHYVGSTKIIRLASASSAEPAAEKDMAALPQPEQAPAPRAQDTAAAPVPSPRPQSETQRAAPVEEPVREVVDQPAAQEPARAETAPALEPWTDEWLADCVARFESFDASLGTYIGENGQRRFCTGDPA